MPVLPFPTRVGAAARGLADPATTDDPFVIAENIRAKSKADSEAADARIKALDELNAKLAKDPPLQGVNGYRGTGRWPLAVVPPVPSDPNEKDQGGAGEETIGGVPLSQVGSMGPEDDPAPEPAPPSARSDDEVRARLKELSDQRDAADMHSKVLGLDKTPDQAASDQTLASTLGKNPIEVEADRDSAKSSELAQRIGRLSTDAPKLRAWLAEPENLAVAHDDTDNLSWWDTLTHGAAALTDPRAGAGLHKFAGEVGQAAGAAVPAFKEAGIGLLQRMLEQPIGASQPGDITFTFGKKGVGVNYDADGGKGGVRATDFLPDAAPILSSESKKAQAETEKAVPQNGNWIHDQLLLGVQNLAVNTPAIAVGAATRNPELALAIMGAQTSGQKYGELRNSTDPARKDMAPDEARYHADLQGTIEMAGELVPMHQIIGDIKTGTPFVKSLTKQFLSEIPAEEAQQFLEDLDDWGTEHPTKTLGEFIAERPSVAASVFMQTLVSVGGTATVAHGVNAVTGHVAQQGEIAAAKNRATIIEQMQTNAVDSKLLKRSEPKFQDWVTTATKGGPVENVSIPADKFAEYYNEHGGDPAAMAQSVGVTPEAFTEALQSGHDITIPTGAYAAKIAKEDGGMEALGQHVRFAPDQMTAFEADTASKEFNAELQAYVEAYKQAAEGKATLDHSEQKVLDDITEKIKATGVYETRGETIPANAAVMGAMAATLAKRVGMDPWEFWQKHGPEIQAHVAGETLGTDDAFQQSAPRQGRTIGDEELTRASEQLTPTQFEAFKLAAEGLSNADIAARMSDEDGRNALVEPPAFPDKLSEQGRTVLKLRAQGVDRKAIAAQVFGDREQDKALNQIDQTIHRYPGIIAALKRHNERGLTTEAIGAHLAHARARGFHIEMAPTGKQRTRETNRIIDLKAQGVSNKLIAERIYPDRASDKAENLVKQLIFQHKDEIAAKRSQLALAQGGNRGEFLRRPGQQRSVITLFESRNQSTLMHEAAHWYLDLLKQMGEQENAHPFVTQQLEAIAKWAGVETIPETFGEDGTPTPEWREVQEKFAETFETYLETGKAPSVALRKAFAAFKRWLVSLYRQIGRGGLTRANLTPEITDVMNRMLAIEDETDAAHQELVANAQDMAEALLKKGIIKSPAEYARVMARLPEAREQAEAEMLAKSLAALRREKTAEYREETRRTRQEVAREIDQRPEQRALAWLGRGQWMGERNTSQPGAFGQSEELRDFLKYFDPEATDESLAALRMRMLGDKVVPVIRLFKTTDGHVIAFNGDKYTHSEARDILGIPHMKLKHGMYEPWNGPLARTNWYDTSGHDEHAWVPDASLAQSGGPIFFSQLSRVVANSTTSRASPEQWKATISKAPGVKQEELEWTGVLDWLAAQKSRWVEKADLAAFLQANGVQVGEVIANGEKGRFYAFQDEETGNWGVYNQGGEIVQDLGNNEQAARHVAESKDNAIQTRFGQYTVPGGEDYSELLLTLPMYKNEANPSAPFIGGKTAADDYIYRPHWGDEPNVVAFTRFKTRKGPNGEKVLALEEVQSDWHQQGREKGYNTGVTDAHIGELEQRSVVAERKAREAGIAVAEAAYDNDDIFKKVLAEMHRGTARQESAAQMLEGGAPLVQQAQLTPEGVTFRATISRMLQADQGSLEVTSDFEPMRAELEAFNDAGVEALNARQAELAVVNAVRIPDAPFKNNGWAALVLKRMVRWAAENGYDQLAWTPGSVHADRWGHSEGMTAFYDKVLVNEANKLGKKYGAQAGLIPLGPDKTVMTRPNGDRLEFTNRANAEAGALRDDVLETRPAHDFHSLPITSELKKAALEGQPLFQSGDGGWGPTVPPTNLPPMRLSLAATREQYGEEAVKALPASVIAHAVPEGAEHPEAIGPNEAAELLSAALGGGFQSGNVLLEALQSAESRNRQIAAEVQRRMRENYPDPYKDGTLEEEAAEHARNEVQYYQSELELEALARAVGLRPAKNAAKIEAQRQLSQMTVKQVLGYRIFLTYERRASGAALKAATKGDALEAMLYKQRALINQVLYSEGAKLAEKIETTRKFMLGFDKPERQKRLFAAGQDYLDQMNGLIEDYEFRPRTNKEIAQRQSLREWFGQKQAEADPLTVKDKTQTPEESLADQEEATARSRYLEALEDEAQVKHYTELTMDELDNVRANAGAIWTMAKTVDRLLQDQERRSITLAAGDIKASIEAEQPKPLPKPSLESELPENRRKRSIGTYLAEHRTLQTLARQFDGGKDGGKFWNYIVRPLNEAFAHLSTLRSQASKDVAKLFKVYTQREIAHLERGKMFIKAIDTTLTHQGRLAVALNAGNAKNLKRLMDSEGWSKQQVQAVIDTLDKRDMDFVQSVFAYVDTFFTDANAVHERVHGFPMTKEAAMPMQTKFGTYAGGYYPIQFDSARSAVTGQRALEADARNMGGRVGARTEIGSAKTRVEGKVTIPLKLSVFDVITRHVDQVITSIAMEKALLDVGRLVVRQEVKDAIISRHGVIRYNAILSSLRETKNGQEVIRKARDRILVHLRNGQTIVGLALNLHTALLQPLGLSNSIVRVGGYWMTKGILRAGATAVDRLRGVNFIKERSEFMRNRELAQNRELADLRADIRPGFVPPWVARGMMVHIMKTQYLAVDVPTWFGQYEKSIAAQWSDKDASAHADQAVIDAQGSGETHALADVQRGSPIWKLFTNFMSFFLTVYNLSAQRIGNTNFKNPGQVAHLAADMALLWSFPVAAQFFLDKWLLGGGDDDPWAEYLKQQLAFLMSPFAVLNQLAGAVQGFDYRGPQGLTALADASKAIPQAGKAIDDARQGDLQTAADDLTDKNFWRPANRTAGAIFHYPAGQIDRTVRGIQQLQSGETDDLSVILFGPKRAPK